jgi:hypothetical protein
MRCADIAASSKCGTPASHQGKQRDSEQLLSSPDTLRYLRHEPRAIFAARASAKSNLFWNPSE